MTVGGRHVGYVPADMTAIVAAGADAEVLRLSQWPGPVNRPNTRPHYLKIKVAIAAAAE